MVVSALTLTADLIVIVHLHVELTDVTETLTSVRRRHTFAKTAARVAMSRSLATHAIVLRGTTATIVKITLMNVHPIRATMARALMRSIHTAAAVILDTQDTTVSLTSTNVKTLLSFAVRNQAVLIRPEATAAFVQ